MQIKITLRNFADGELDCRVITAPEAPETEMHQSTLIQQAVIDLAGECVLEPGDRITIEELV